MIGRWEYLTFADRITDVPRYTMFLDDENPSESGSPRFRLELSCTARKPGSFRIGVLRRGDEFPFDPTSATVDLRVDKLAPIHQSWRVVVHFAIQPDPKLTRIVAAVLQRGVSLFLRITPNKGSRIEAEFKLDDYALAFARMSSDCRLGG